MRWSSRHGASGACVTGILDSGRSCRYIRLFSRVKGGSQEDFMRRMDRRDFLKGSAALGGAVVLSGCGSSSGIKADTGGGASSVAPVSYGGRTLRRAEQARDLGVAGLRGGRHQGPDLRHAGRHELHRASTAASQPQVRRHRQRRQDAERDEGGPEVRPAPPLRRLHPGLRQRGRRAAVRHQPAAQLRQPLPRDDRPRQGQRPAVLDPLGLGLSQSILYRKDKVDPADAPSWELFWNEKYKGKISMWDGGSTPVEIAGLLIGPAGQGHRPHDGRGARPRRRRS